VSYHDYVPFGDEIPGGINSRSAVLYASADAVNKKFTGQYRDTETQSSAMPSGLDYFGARYFSSAQGRFTSPDPVTGTALHLINPQRWNMYAYAVNNPLFYTDPDGRDAVAVGFKTLAVHAGHAAVISVHRDGSATFGSYGPKGGGKPIWPGEYVAQDLTTKVAFGPDGTASAASFAALAAEVAGIEGVDVSTVDMDYFKTTDAETVALDQYLNSIDSRKHPGNGGLYVVGLHDCIEVCNIALSKAGIGRGSEYFDVPRFSIWNYSSMADSTYSGQTGAKKENHKKKRDKPDVHSTIKYCPEGGCQK
jgi:RHS repeat-associated protein